MHLEFLDDDRLRACTLEPNDGTWLVRLDGGEPWSATAGEAGVVDLLVDGRRRRAWVARRDGERLVFLDGRVHAFRLAAAADDAAEEAIVPGGPLVTANMPGKVVKVHVAAGDVVAAGDPLLILEAMKMEAELPAPLSGRVVRVLVEAGQTVSQGDLLLEIAAGEGEAS